MADQPFDYVIIDSPNPSAADLVDVAQHAMIVTSLGVGPGVVSFDSLEEAQAYMQRGIEAANAAATDAQRAIGWGDHFLHVWEGLAIFGDIPTREHFEASERALAVYADSDEIEQIMAMADDNYANGFRFAKCYSVVEPDGEYGDTHVSQMWPISREQFEIARLNGWRI